MRAQCRSRAHGIDWTEQRALYGVLFNRAGYRAKQCVSGEKSGHGDGERVGGYIAQRGETRIVDLLLAALRVEFHNLDGEWIVEVGGRVVECKVAVYANAAAHNIDRRGAELRGVVCRRLHGIVAGLDQMHGGEGEVIEDCAAQPHAETLRRIRGKAEIFVHVEGSDARPVDFFLCAQRSEHFALAGRGGEDHSHAWLRTKTRANFARDVRRRMRAHRAAGLRYVNGKRVERRFIQCRHSSS